MSFQISPSARMRPSPFYESTVADGVKSFSVYNHMLMPTGYGDPQAEYTRLIEGVAMWDVACERQVELHGPDAAKLAQVLTPRRLDQLAVGVGWYVAVCDHRGVIINDPIVLKIAPDRFWFSIADSDLLLWARAVAAERGLDVDVFEPDVSPLAVQGPRAEDAVAALLGDAVRDIGFFRFREMTLQGIPLVVARSGWSKQGGFELYLRDGRQGNELWRLVKEAGKPFGIGPGNPNPWERVESGLLSYGGDTDDETNPFEVRLSRYVDLDAPDDVVGIDALRRIHAAGVKRHQLGVRLDTPAPLEQTPHREPVLADGERVGVVTAVAWSPRLDCNIGLCLLDRAVDEGTLVTVERLDGTRHAGELAGLPFV